MTVDEAIPEILVDTDETRVIDEAIAALARAPEIYVAGHHIADIIVDTPTTKGVLRSGPIARMRPTPGPMVRELLARWAAWIGMDRRGKPGSIRPPGWWLVSWRGECGRVSVSWWA